ncbi:MAG: hypothetical protein NXY57DRAFT_293077 [Lentinula lateritia]|uniref:Zn(2)-C6 fungal-type domain-containing protein n=1 Tax=Lentinula lateritia TaxID=40482 RepID=A0ABQ8V961_9AGAR|nr:MAG: hypothetical protein NXY57DRAFT_293077 [Lentinula lateritia]KAJ4477958.1 hypothetical protein C8R41DRAFT_517614 [Lentinula lateritia]
MRDDITVLYTMSAARISTTCFGNVLFEWEHLIYKGLVCLRVCTRQQISSLMQSNVSNGPTSLRKGQACIYCRRRKMRCDGARPICGQCRRGQRPDDCEYTDRQGQSRMEALENSIARLKARIHELENPGAPMGEAVVLRQPYSQTMGLPSGDYSALADPSPGATNAVASTSSAQPPKEIILILLDKFFEHAASFGFFLSADNFRASTLLPHPMGDPRRPLDSLLATVYLFGCLFSDNPAWQARSPEYLAQALQSTGLPGLAGNHPQKVLHTIQAEVLLANYFFSAGRLLEGRYHVSTAMSLCVGSGLNKIRSPDLMMTIDNHNDLFPKANGPVEVGERIMAWWVTLSLDQGWAAAFEINSYNDLIIAETETPWPLRVEDYLRGQLTPNAPRSSLTVQSFLDGANRDNSPQSSPLELAAKASLLWKQAHLLKEASTAANIGALLEATRDRIEELLVLLNALQDRDSSDFSLLLARGTAHAAFISLICLRSSNAENLEKVVYSSLAILEIIRKLEPRNKYINPLFTMFWTLANRSLISILHRIPNISDNKRNLIVTAMQSGLLAMNQFGANWSSLTKYEVHKVHEMLANI